jgi:hypothetical protein
MTDTQMFATPSDAPIMLNAQRPTPMYFAAVAISPSIFYFLSLLKNKT